MRERCGQGAMRIRAHTRFFFSKIGGVGSPSVHSQVPSAKMLASRQVLRVSAQKQFSPALAARSCTSAATRSPRSSAVNASGSQRGDP